LTKFLPYILFENYIYISALEVASSGKRHSANCIGTLSFPIPVLADDTVLLLLHATRLLPAFGSRSFCVRPFSLRR